MKLQPKDFMVGDWVLVDGNPEQLTGVDKEYIHLEGNCSTILLEGEVEPIPLTPEILVKNGFEYKEGETGMYGVTTASHYLCKGVPFEVFCDGEPFAIWFKEPVNIKFVHELQRALRFSKNK